MYNRLLLNSSWIALALTLSFFCQAFDSISYGKYLLINPHQNQTSTELPLTVSVNDKDTLNPAEKIRINHLSNGFVLEVNNKPFFIKGMNWDYFPIGTNFQYSLWNQPTSYIKSALDFEMSLLKDIGVNAIRVYTGIPPVWIQYIHENYGIYTMVNHSFGRYGLTVNGQWVPHTDYSDEETKAQLLNEVLNMVDRYQNTPGLLLYLLGNENNYGLFWEGAETENIPKHQKKSLKRAKCMYRLFNEAAIQMKRINASVPIAMCNGDLLFLDLIKKECSQIDVLGINVYRGATFTDLFDRVGKEFNKPVVLTEFGVDAFDAKMKEENQRYQAEILINNWAHLYKNAAGMGHNGNCLGGFTFQFSDGWWKTGQTVRLDKHDSSASWVNGGYKLDFVEGRNNMNEEWFGVCAKGFSDSTGMHKLYPRAAYYALKKVHNFNPYTSNTSNLDEFIQAISIREALLKAENKAVEMK